jgi:PKD repeat protein
MTATASVLRRSVAASVALLIGFAVLALLPPRTARADSAPPSPSPATPTTVTADGLPTVQVDGVVWAQAVVGNTVYAGGSFSAARPAGAAPGTQETVRNNLLAFDIRTGNLITSFTPDLNGQVLAVTASPDGSRIYVGGDFTVANGQTRQRVAAYDTATGALITTWRPTVNSQVRAIAATNDTVYLGGSITAVGGVSRNRLAAVGAATGALLPWAPQPGVGSTAGNRDGNTATSNAVLALVLTNGGTQVVAGGRFDSLNGVQATGVGALDAETGETRPFAINALITNQGVNSAVWSLTTDATGTTVYGSGYDFYGPGNLEGSFAATADGGAVVMINACHGDTYSTFPVAGVLYQATHAHECSPIDGYPEQDPRVNMFATAVTTVATRTVHDPVLRNNNFRGQPAPSLLPWFPDMDAGSYTGQLQAGWSTAGNADYVVFGGEFPRVNGVGQQGLVRFTVPGNAPNRIGPSFAGFTTTAVSIAPGVARVSWPATSDQDNEYLIYRVYRDGDTSTPLYERTQASTWWNRPVMVFSDSGAGGGAHRYRVVATDPFGNAATTPWATVDVAAGGGGQERQYDQVVLADGAQDHWPLGEQSGSTAYDYAGAADLPVGSGVTLGRPGAVAGDPDTAAAFDGTSNGLLATQTAVPGPNVFSLEAWFRTTTTAGGKIVGFGSANTGISSNRDRHIYMETDGRVSFGVYTGVRQAITGSTAYNDGDWHHVVGTLGPGGLALYVDGAQVAARSDVTSAQAYNGYWRIGGDRGWSGADYWTGDVDEVAVYPTVLSAAQVADHFSLATTGTPTNVPPTAAFTGTPTGLTVALDATSSTDDGTIASYAWDFGSGQTTTGPTASHTFPAAGTYPVTLTVTDDQGAIGTVTHDVTVTDPPPNPPPTAAFTVTTAELTASVDASGSADDGQVTGYAWAFGDGGTAAGATATHTYASAGTFTVTLTVTDDGGATGTVNHDVTVTAPNGPPVLADDTFGRSTTDGLGIADVGGVWQVSAGATRQSVSPGAATLTLPAAGNNTGSYLPISQTYADLRTSFAATSTPTGNGTYVYLTGRRTGAGEYRVRVRLLADGRVGLALSRVSGGTEAFPGGETIVSGVTYASPATLNAHVLVTGSGTTTVQATVWTTGAEPAPQLTRTDTTAALQAAGGVGITAHRPTGTTTATAVRFTSFRVVGEGDGTPTTNASPTAAFSASSAGLTATFDTTGTADSDGSIASYAWNWGDGTAAGSGPAPSHGYTADGTYTVTLTVTDDDGATATVSHDVTVAAPPDAVPPTAAFTATATGLSISVDGSGSTDDGAITSYAWTFGDDTSGTGVTTSHTYAAAGTYSVTLTVTDDDSTTGTVSHDVTVTVPQGPPAIAGDTFDRTVTSGWGTATVGGAWTSSAGPTRQSVSPGVGEFRLDAANQNTGAYLGAVAQTSADVRTTLTATTAPTGNGTYVYVSGRRVDGAGEYRVRVRLLADGRVALALSRLTGTTEAFPGGELVLAGLTYTPGTALNVHVQVLGTGTTTIRATVWTTGTEPAAWQLTRTDTTAALQVDGGIGLTAHRPSGTTAATAVRFTTFRVTAAG